MNTQIGSIQNNSLNENFRIKDYYIELEDLFTQLNYDVVVVEDDLTTSEFIKAVGYATNESSRIKSFVRAEDAFEHIKNLSPENSPDLAIIDIHLKGNYDGYWLCEKLATQFPHIQIVVISSLNPTLVSKRLKASSIEAQYLMKPFTISQIASLFDKIV